MSKQHKTLKIRTIWRKIRHRSYFTFLLLLPCIVGFGGIFLFITTLSDKSPTPINFTHIDKFSNYIHHSADSSAQKQSNTLNLSNTSSNALQPNANYSMAKNRLRITPIQPDWQPVTGTSEKFFVYSAYYIEKPVHVIRVIGTSKTKSRQRVLCRLYDSSGVHFNTTNGTIRTIRENWNLKYSACFIICHLPPESSRPGYISVTSSTSKLGIASNLIKITYNQRRNAHLDTEGMFEFSACVKPIHFSYDNTLHFLEWMEFHKLMGVTHFTFYNDTIGQKVNCLLTTIYKDLVTVLPWRLPMISQKEIRTEGLFAALNDCIYRHRGTTKYLVLVDLDEMIVPNKAKNYGQLLHDVLKISKKKNIGAYSFQNGFFYLQWPDSAADYSNYNFTDFPLAEKISTNLVMLQKMRRKSRLHPHKQRSKYICNPQMVIEAGNHFIWEMTAGYTTLQVPPHQAVLHHYRLCEFGGNQCIKDPSIIDKSILPFGRQIAINVAQKIEEISYTCLINVT